MKLQVRKLIERDWSFLPQWWEAKENDPIAAMFLYTTNSKTAIPAVVVSDRYYKDNDRSDALQLLVDFTKDFAQDMGFKYSFAWAKTDVLLDKYTKSGFTSMGSSHELLIKY